MTRPVWSVVTPCHSPIGASVSQLVLSAQCAPSVDSYSASSAGLSMGQGVAVGVGVSVGGGVGDGGICVGEGVAVRVGGGGVAVWDGVGAPVGSAVGVVTGVGVGGTSHAMSAVRKASARTRNSSARRVFRRATLLAIGSLSLRIISMEQPYSAAVFLSKALGGREGSAGRCLLASGPRSGHGMIRLTVRKIRQPGVHYRNVPQSRRNTSWTGQPVRAVSRRSTRCTRDPVRSDWPVGMVILHVVHCAEEPAWRPSRYRQSSRRAILREERQSASCHCVSSCRLWSTSRAPPRRASHQWEPVSAWV